MSEVEVNHFLGFPKILVSTGEAQATAVAIIQHQDERLSGACFIKAEVKFKFFTCDAVITF